MRLLVLAAAVVVVAAVSGIVTDVHAAETWCSSDRSRCVPSACPRGWLAVGNALASPQPGDVACASRRFLPFPPQDVGYACESAVAGADVPAGVAISQPRALTGANVTFAVNAMEALRAADPDVAVPRVALSGAFVDNATIAWFDPTDRATTAVADAQLDAATAAYLAGPDAAASTAAGTPVGCVAITAAGVLSIVGCGSSRAANGTPQLPFVCLVSARVAAATAAPTTGAANGTASPAEPTATPVPNTGDNVTTPAPLPNFPQPAVPCVDGFAFSSVIDACVTVIGTERGAVPAMDSAAACRAVHYYAFPLAVNSTAATVAAALALSRAGSDVAGAGSVHRSTRLAWTGGVFSTHVGAGAWADPQLPQFRSLPAGVWSPAEPRLPFGCIAAGGADGRLRLADCDDRLPVLCSYPAGDTRTPPPQTPPPTPPTAPPTPAPPAVPTPPPGFEPECLPGWVRSTAPVRVTRADAERGVVATVKCVQVFSDASASGFVADRICAEHALLDRDAARRAFAGRDDLQARYERSLRLDPADAFAASMGGAADVAIVRDQLSRDAQPNTNAGGEPEPAAVVGAVVVNNGDYGFWFDSRTAWDSGLPRWSPGHPHRSAACAEVTASGVWRSVPCAELRPGVACEYLLHLRAAEAPTEAPPTAAPRPIDSRLAALDGRMSLRVAAGTLGAHRVGSVGGSLAGQHLFFSPTGDCPTDPAVAARIIAERPDALAAVSADGYVYPTYDRETATGVVCTVVPAAEPPIDTPRFARSNVTFIAVAGARVTAVQLASLRVNEAEPSQPIPAAAAMRPLTAAASASVALEPGFTGEVRLFGAVDAGAVAAVRFSDSLKCGAPAFVYGPRAASVTAADAVHTGGAAAVATLEGARTRRFAADNDQEEGDTAAAAVVTSQPAAFHLCVSTDGVTFTATSVNATSPATDIAVTSIGAMLVAGVESPPTVPEHSSPTLLLQGRGLAQGMLVRLSSDGTCAVRRDLLVAEGGVASFPRDFAWDIPMVATPAGLAAHVTSEHTRVRATNGRIQDFGNAFAEAALESSADAVPATTTARFTVCVAASQDSPFFSAGHVLSVTRTTVSGLGAHRRVGQGFAGPLAVHGINRQGVRAATIDRMRVVFARSCPVTLSEAAAPYGAPLAVVAATGASGPVVVAPPGYFARATTAPLAVCLSVDGGVTWADTDATLDVVPAFLVGLGDRLVAGPSAAAPSSTPVAVEVSAGRPHVVPMAGTGLGTHLVAALTRRNCHFAAAFDPVRDVVVNASVISLGSVHVDDTAARSLGSGAQYAVALTSAQTVRFTEGTTLSVCLIDTAGGALHPTRFALRFREAGVERIAVSSQTAVAVADGAVPYAYTGAIRLTGTALDDASVVPADTTAAQSAAQACMNRSSWLWPEALTTKRVTETPAELSSAGVWAIRVSERQTASIAAFSDARTAGADGVWCVRLHGAAFHVPVGTAQYRVVAINTQRFAVTLDGAAAQRPRTATGASVVVEAGAGASVQMLGTAEQVRDAVAFLQPRLPGTEDEGLATADASCRAAAAMVAPSALLAVELGRFLLPPAVTTAMGPGRYGVCLTAAPWGSVVGAVTSTEDAGNATTAPMSVVVAPQDFLSAGPATIDLVAPEPALLAAYLSASDAAQGAALRTLRLAQGSTALIVVRGEDLREGHAVRLSPLYPPRCDRASADPLATYAIGQANLTAPPRDAALLPLTADGGLWALPLSAEQTAVAEGTYTLCVSTTGSGRSSAWRVAQALRVEIAQQRIVSLRVRSSANTFNSPAIVDPATGALRVRRGVPPLQLSVEVDGELPAHTTLAFVTADVPLNADGSCRTEQDGGVFAPITVPDDRSDPYVRLPVGITSRAGASYRVCADLAIAGVHTPLAADLIYPPRAGLPAVVAGAHSASKFSRVTVVEPVVSSVTVDAAIDGVVPARVEAVATIRGEGIARGMVAALLPATDGLRCADIGSRVSSGAPANQQPLIDAAGLAVSPVEPATTADGIEGRQGAFPLLAAQTDASAVAALMGIARSRNGRASDPVLPDGSVTFTVCFSYDRQVFLAADGNAIDAEDHTSATLLRVAAVPTPPPPPTVQDISARQSDGTWHDHAVASTERVTVHASLSGFTEVTRPPATAACPSPAPQPIIVLTGARFAGSQHFFAVSRSAALAAGTTACGYGNPGAQGTVALDAVRVSALLNRVELTLSAAAQHAGVVAAGQEYDLCVAEVAGHPGDDDDADGGDSAASLRPLRAVASPDAAAETEDVRTAHVSLVFTAAPALTATRPAQLTSLACAIDASISAGTAGTIPVTVVTTAVASTAALWVRLVDPAIGCAALHSHERVYRVANATAVGAAFSSGDGGQQVQRWSGMVLVPAVDMTSRRAAFGVCIAAAPSSTASTPPSLAVYSRTDVAVSVRSVRSIDGALTLAGPTVVEGRPVDVQLAGVGVAPGMRVRILPVGDADLPAAIGSVCPTTAAAGSSADCTARDDGRARCVLPFAAHSAPTSDVVVYRVCLAAVDGAVVPSVHILQAPGIIARRARVEVLRPVAESAAAALRYGADGTRTALILPGTAAAPDVELIVSGEGIDAGAALGIGCNGYAAPLLVATVYRVYDTVASSRQLRVGVKPSALAALPIPVENDGRFDVCLRLGGQFRAQPGVFVKAGPAAADSVATPSALRWSILQPASAAAATMPWWDAGKEAAQQRCLLALVVTTDVADPRLPAAGESARVTGAAAPMPSRVSWHNESARVVPVCSAPRSDAAAVGSGVIAVSTRANAAGLGGWSTASDVAAVVAPARLGASGFAPAISTWTVPGSPGTKFVAVASGDSAILNVDLQAGFTTPQARFVQGASCAFDHAAIGREGTDAVSPATEVVAGRLMLSASFTQRAAVQLGSWPPQQPLVTAAVMASATFSVCVSLDGGATYAAVPDIRLAVYAPAEEASTTALPRHIRVPQGSRGVLPLTGYVARGLLAAGTVDPRLSAASQLLGRGALWFPEGSLVMLSSTCARSADGIPTTVVSAGGIALLSDAHTARTVSKLRVCVRRRDRDTASSTTAGNPSWLAGMLGGFTTAGFIDTGLTLSVADAAVAAVNAIGAPVATTTTTTDAAAKTFPLVLDDAAVDGAAWPMRAANTAGAEILRTATIRVGRPCDRVLAGALGRPQRLTQLDGQTLLLELPAAKADGTAFEEADVAPGDALSVCVSLPSGDDADGDGLLDESPFYMALPYPIAPVRRATSGCRPATGQITRRPGRGLAASVACAELPVHAATADILRYATSVAWQGPVATADAASATMYLRDWTVLVPGPAAADGEAIASLPPSSSSSAPLELVAPNGRTRAGPVGVTLTTAAPLLRWVNAAGDGYNAGVLADAPGFLLPFTATPALLDGELVELRTAAAANTTTSVARRAVVTDGGTALVVPPYLELAFLAAPAVDGAAVTLGFFGPTGAAPAPVAPRQPEVISVFGRPTAHRVAGLRAASGAAAPVVAIDQAYDAVVPVEGAAASDAAPLFARFALPEDLLAAGGCPALSGANGFAVSAAAAPLVASGLVGSLFPVLGGVVRIPGVGAARAATWGVGSRGAVAMCFTADGVNYHAPRDVVDAAAAAPALLLLSVDPPRLMGFADAAQPGRVFRLLRLPEAQEKEVEEVRVGFEGTEEGPGKVAEFAEDPVARAVFRKPLLDANSSVLAAAVRPGALLTPQFAEFESGRSTALVAPTATYSSSSSSSGALQVAVVPLPQSDDASPDTWCSTAAHAAVARLSIDRATGVATLVDGAEAPLAAGEGEGAPTRGGGETAGESARRKLLAAEEDEVEAKKSTASGYHVLCVTADSGATFFAGTERRATSARETPIFADLDAAGAEEPCSLVATVRAASEADAAASAEALVQLALNNGDATDDATAIAAVSVQVDAVVAGRLYAASIRPLAIERGRPGGVRRLLELLLGAARVAASANDTDAGAMSTARRLVATDIVTEDGVAVPYFDDAERVKANDGYFDVHVTRRFAARPVLVANPTARHVDRMSDAETAARVRGDAVETRGYILEPEERTLMGTFLLLLLLPVAVAVVVMYCLRTTCATGQLLLERDDFVDEVRDREAMGGGVHLSPLSA